MCSVLLQGRERERGRNTDEFEIQNRRGREEKVGLLVFAVSNHDFAVFTTYVQNRRACEHSFCLSIEMTRSRGKGN